MNGMLFQIYGDMSMWQLLGWCMVFVGLVVANEIARRTKAGGIFCFVVIPVALTIYFIVINIGAKTFAADNPNSPRASSLADVLYAGNTIASNSRPT